MVTSKVIPVRIDPTLTISGEQLANLVERLDDPSPGPRHTVGVDIKQAYLSDMPMSAPFLDILCSCGWRGDKLTINQGRHLDPADIPDHILEEAARMWRFHVRLSNRVHGFDRKLRRQARRTRQNEEEE